MKVVVEDEIRTIKTAKSQKGVDIIKQTIFAKENLILDFNGFPVLTEEEFQNWSYQAQLYREKRKKEVEADKTKTDKVVDSEDVLEGGITPVIEPTIKNTEGTEKKYSSETEALKDYIESLGDKKEKNKTEAINLSKKRNPKRKKPSDQEGFDEEEDIAFYAKEPLTPEELAIFTPIVQPKKPDIDSLPKKEKKISDDTPEDKYKEYEKQMEKQLLSASKKLEVLNMELKDFIVGNPIEELAKDYDYDFNKDILFLDTRPHIVNMTEKLIKLLSKMSRRANKTDSQYLIYLLLQDYQKAIDTDKEFEENEKREN